MYNEEGGAWERERRLLNRGRSSYGASDMVAADPASKRTENQFSFENRRRAECGRRVRRWHYLQLVVQRLFSFVPRPAKIDVF